jgi:glycosyltransferase involved in cell wall biosynthesis
MREPVTGEATPRPAERRMPGTLPPVICFSHLRWGFVWQRPQHLLDRLARDTAVFFVEEPEFAAAGEPCLTTTSEGGVTVITPLLPLPDGTESPWGFNHRTNQTIRALLASYFRGLREELTRPILWYYTPMAHGAEPDGLSPSLVVFDAMDELANFLGAPAELRAQEAALVARADLVFTGGPSLYEARKDRHPAVHCFPSGVEPAHFAQAANGIPRPPDLDGRPRPVLGFYGVIDERIDLDLLTSIADARPAWTIAMVGPVAKIDPADLPNRPNILYFGKQAYRDLPAYLACFDVAMLPFACNEATRFISPTKTLEYLAGQKPVVSTPIRDVVDLYGTVVDVAETATEMVAAIERILAEPDGGHARRTAATRALLTWHDWEAIAGRMRALIDATIAHRATAKVASPVGDERSAGEEDGRAANPVPVHGTLTRLTHV